MKSRAVHPHASIQAQPGGGGYRSIQITTQNLQLLLGRILLPGLCDVGEFPGGLVQPGKSMLGSDNELILLGLAHDIGGDTKVSIISR